MLLVRRRCAAAPLAGLLGGGGLGAIRLPDGPAPPAAAAAGPAPPGRPGRLFPGCRCCWAAVAAAAAAARTTSHALCACASSSPSRPASRSYRRSSRSLIASSAPTGQGNRTCGGARGSSDDRQSAVGPSCVGEGVVPRIGDCSRGYASTAGRCMQAAAELPQSGFRCNNESGQQPGLAVYRLSGVRRLLALSATRFSSPMRWR